MSVSFCMFPCSKGHSVRVYLDTILKTLYGSCLEEAPNMALLVFCMKKHYHKTVKIKMMSLLVVTTPELGRVFSYVYCFSAHKVIAYKSCLEHIMAGTDL